MTVIASEAKDPCAGAFSSVSRGPSRFALRMTAGVLLAACTTSATPSAIETRAGAIPSHFDPHAPLTASQQRWIDSTLATLSLRQRVGQMVTVWLLGDYTSTADSTFREVVRWVERDGIGGISMSLGTPIEVAAKLNDLQRRANVPLIVSADLEPNLGRLEGGVFTHYMLDAGGATVFPTAMAIAATGRDQDAYDVAKAIAEEGRAVGIHVNFAPVVDVNNNPANPVINTRSFGEDPQRVARLSALFVRGTQDGGEMATAKHFPGHGDTDVDSHVGLPVVSATMARLDTIELVPFRAAIAAGASLVMTAHIALPAIEGDSTTPATLAPRIITGLLRDTLGFRGVAITDAMTMEGVGKGYTTEQSSVLAVQAGADILLKPSDPTRAIDAVVAAVERGEISRARIDSSVRHVLELKVRSGATANRFVSLEHLREVVGSGPHRALAADVSQRSITLLRDRDHAVPLQAGDGGSVFVVRYAPETEIKAGRSFEADMRAAFKGRVGFARIGPGATSDLLDSLGQVAGRAQTVVVTAYVRRVEGSGRVAVPTPIADWIDRLAEKQRVIVAAFGNPYLIAQFPNVDSYMTAYGVSDDLEHATVRALLGRAPITGRAPISLPGVFQAGDGITR
jgi:beta-N-acetylhexosaminidase